MVLRNMHPADELAFVRNDIKRLKRREAQLHQGLLSGVLSRQGMDAVVEVEPLRKRVFLRDKLPEHILENEAYWRTDVTRQLRIAPAPGTSGNLFR